MTSNAPLVSIILPTYNGSSFIRQSIDSCINQTFTNFELIIVDDCSVDKTPSIIQSYNDVRIRYHRNETNQRLPKSLNIGFALARGQFLTWTSDDNLYLPTALDKMVAILKKGQADFVYADIFSFKNNDINQAEAVALEDPLDLPRTNCIRACFMYTRTVMEAIGGYNADMELIEDYDYWVRIWKQFKLAHIKEPLYYYRYHEAQLYTARYKEIRIIEILFKLKYHFMDESQTNWHLRKLYSGTSLIDRVKLRVFDKPRIDKILNAFTTGQKNFTTTRKQLNTLINGAK